VVWWINFFMTSWINLFKKEDFSGIDNIVKTGVVLVTFSIPTLESRDEILLRGIDL
jgi:hypothetical protein